MKQVDIPTCDPNGCIDKRNVWYLKDRVVVQLQEGSKMAVSHVLKPSAIASNPIHVARAIIQELKSANGSSN